MNNRMASRDWLRSALVGVLVGVGVGVLAALPADPAAAHGAAHDEPSPMVLDCALGSAVDYTKSCVFDTNGDGAYDWVVVDTDGDSRFDTSELDTDFDGRAETFYTIIGTLYGEVRVRYDHDGDWLYDEEEVAYYGTDPFLWDTDGDGYGDNMELAEASDPLNWYCTPTGCG